MPSPHGKPKTHRRGSHFGEFQLVRDGELAPLKADRSLMQTEQRAEDAILRLAENGA